jgi:hypothetical protein
MKKRNYDTPVGLLVETEVFERIKFIAQQRKVSMSDIIRDGIKLKLAKIDEENIWGGTLK